MKRFVQHVLGAHTTERLTVEINRLQWIFFSSEQTFLSSGNTDNECSQLQESKEHIVFVGREKCGRF